ncbi:hypothetical protein P3T36_000858 [Kitasatospora sp. MAP12-15]|uniref:hypothetical protein n=1 Tax=unclassified Kitasatospora TaxID=2633591 RepID=UPI00247665F1|nr:hypothetical protein [Kitasatospora sp. MAP12-44]MDH6114458.1 hypothetical protein [Kitasatospora sp. MAP12-44]
MRRYRNYWAYSCGLGVAWAVLLGVTAAVRGESELHRVLPVFGGFCIGWVSTTIARYVYPPPQRWTAKEPRSAEPRSAD